MEKAFFHLLRDYLPADTRIVPTYVGLDETPAITIDQADEYFVDRRPLNIDGKQYYRKRYHCNIWINIFCNTERERYDLINFVENRILQAETNHYTTCERFNPEDNFCNILNDECEALKSHNGRAAKKQCPKPKDYKYSSFFKKNNIIKNTFKIDSVTNLDELTTDQNILRTIFKLDFEYYKYYEIGGQLLENIEINEDLL